MAKIIKSPQKILQNISQNIVAPLNMKNVGLRNRNFLEFWPACLILSNQIKYFHRPYWTVILQYTYQVPVISSAKNPQFHKLAFLVLKIHNLFNLRSFFDQNFKHRTKISHFLCNIQNCSFLGKNTRKRLAFVPKSLQNISFGSLPRRRPLHKGPASNFSVQNYFNAFICLLQDPTVTSISSFWI